MTTFSVYRLQRARSHRPNRPRSEWVPVRRRLPTRQSAEAILRERGLTGIGVVQEEVS